MAVGAVLKAGWLVLCGVIGLGAKPPAPPPVDCIGVKEAGLTVYWRAKAMLEDGERLVRIAKVRDCLYLITDRGVAMCYDALSGVMEWSTALVGPGIMLYGPARGPKLAYFSSVFGIQGVDGRTGEVVWHCSGPLTPAGEVVSDGEAVFGGALNGRVFKITLSDCLVDWEFLTDGIVSGRPVLVGKALVVGTQAGKIYACTKADKVKLWQAQTTGPILAGLVTDGKCVFVASADRSLYCFDVATGQMRWKCRMPGPLYREPVLVGQRLYQYSDRQGVWCVDARTGKELWHVPEAVGFLAEHKKLVWLRGKGVLLGVSKADGTVRQKVVCGARLWTANPSGDAIFVATETGQLFCLRPAEVGFLSYRVVQRRMRRGVRRAAPTAVPPLPVERPAARDYLKASESVPPIGGSGVLTKQAAR